MPPLSMPAATGRRAWSSVVTLVVVCSVSWPLMWPIDRDSFPLSNYPMFAWPRLTTMSTIAQVYGVDQTGHRVRLPSSAVGRAPAVTAALDVNRQLELLLLGDPNAITPYCLTIASHVAADPALAGVHRVEIRRDEYDSLAFHAGSKEPARSETFATCVVPR